MIDYKTPEEIQIMAEGGKRLGKILNTLMDQANPGVSLLAIENNAQKLIAEAGGTPSFQTVEDYKWATCLCVNEVVVHGIPTARKLKDGDVLTVDVGMIYEGFHTDTAWTKYVSREPSAINSQLKDFLTAGELALEKGIEQAMLGNRVGHISHAIESIIKPAGYSIVKTLVGHGVGRTLHEDPQVPGYLKGPIDKTPLLQEGLTIAIEVIYAEGNGTIVYDNDDGWTIATRDRSLTSVFEHTIAINPDGPVVLTRS